MDTRLLEKFFRGECSVEEAREVRSWFDAESDKEHLLRHLQDRWQRFEVPEEITPEHDPAALLENIHARLQKERDEESKQVSSQPGSTNQFYFLRVAAIIVLAFGLSFLVQKIMSAEQRPEISYLEKEAPKGRQQAVMLPDGTKITLNADSRLSYPVEFSGNKREVKLEGEAFFEVARDEKRPFTIVSGDVLTTVLGTSFNVKAYQGEQEISVSVAHGKVKVSRFDMTNQAYYLSPGKEAVYQPDKKSFTVQEFEAKETLAWKEGILYFKDATFEEVKKRLERWYGVDIQVVGKAAQEWQYSGIFERQSLDNVLLSIGYVKHFTYEKNGNQVKIIYNNA